MPHSKIYEAIKRAHIDAKAAMERMGMLDLLKKGIEWDSIESGHVAKDCIDGEDDDSDRDKNDDEITPEYDSSVSSLVKEVCSENASDVTSDIHSLSDCSLLHTEVKNKLNNLQKSLVLKQIPSSTVFIFVPCDSAVDHVPTSLDTQKYKMKPKDSPFSRFVKVQASSQRTVFIRKTTAVWLLQESEHVSSDRLFRVRSKQPYSSESNKLLLSTENINENLHVSTLVSLGELCAFMDKDNYWIRTIINLDEYYNLQTAQTNQVSTRNSISIPPRYLSRILEVQCMILYQDRQGRFKCHKAL